MSDFLSAVLHPERARSGGRPGWLSIVGIVLVPLLVGGLLVWALWQPDQRLDRIQAAVVNQDEPVTVDGQTVPLGRQLAAALVTSSGTTTAGASSQTAATPQVTASPGATRSGTTPPWLIPPEDRAETLSETHVPSENGRAPA